MSFNRINARKLRINKDAINFIYQSTTFPLAAQKEVVSSVTFLTETICHFHRTPMPRFTARAKKINKFVLVPLAFTAEYNFAPLTKNESDYQHYVKETADGPNYIKTIFDVYLEVKIRPVLVLPSTS